MTTMLHTLFVLLSITILSRSPADATPPERRRHPSHQHGNAALLALVNRYETLLHAESYAVAPKLSAPSNSASSPSSSKHSHVPKRFLKPLLLFLGVAAIPSSGFVQNPGYHHSGVTTHNGNPGAASTLTDRGPSTASALFSAVNDEEYEAFRKKLERQFGESEQKVIKSIPNHSNISPQKLKTWEEMTKEHIFAQLDRAFIEMTKDIWHDMLHAEEEPLIQYIKRYWDKCGIASFSVGACDQISQLIEPYASIRLKELKAVMDSRWHEQAQQVTQRKESIPYVETRLKIMIRDVNPDLSFAEVNALADTQIQRMTNELVELANVHMKQVINMVHVMLMEFVQHLGEFLVNGDMSAKDEVEFYKRLMEWGAKVRAVVIDYQNNEEWKKEYLEVLNLGPFLKQMRKEKKEKQEMDDNSWQAKRIDDNMMYQRWLQSHNRLSVV